MQKQTYPIEATIPIDSSTHDQYELKGFEEFGTRLVINKDRNTYNIVLRDNVTANNIEKHIWNIADILCLSLAVSQSGVFARTVYYGKGGGLSGVKWLDKAPAEAAATGIKVLNIDVFDHSKIVEAEKLFTKIRANIDTNNTLKAAVAAYTVSCRFFNLDIVRESALNFFTVAEIIATGVLPRTLTTKATYKLSDILKAAKKLGIEGSYIGEGYEIRGELAHGHAKHILLTEHSLGEHEVSSYSIKLPVLKCKQVADQFLRAYIEKL